MASLLVRCKRSTDEHESGTQWKSLVSCNNYNNKRRANMQQQLPFHIWEHIFSKLTPLTREYFRFGAVSKQWYSILSEDRLRRRSPPHLVTPLLLLPTRRCHNGNEKVLVSRLFSATDRKVLEGIDLKVVYDGSYDDVVNFCGSSYGWLFFVGKSYELIMYNPFVCKSIRLPPIMREFDEMPDWRSDLRGYQFWQDWSRIRKNLGLQYAVRKVVLSADPRTTDDYVVVAIYSGVRRLAFFTPKKGDNSRKVSVDDDGNEKGKKGLDFSLWCYLVDDDDDDGRAGGYDDVAINQGRLYAINKSNHTLVVVELDNLKSIGNGNNAFIKASIRINAPSFGWIMNDLWYLTVTSSKELLLIARQLKCKIDGHHHTQTFQVFKLNCDLQQLDEVKTLDGDAVSVSVIASDSTRCQPNSIYYTDDYPYNGMDLGPYGSYGPHDLGCFSLDEGVVTVGYKPKPAVRHWPPPIWILPMF